MTNKKRYVIIILSNKRKENKNMIIRQEKLINFDFNNTGEYREMDVFYKVFEKNGEIKKSKFLMRKQAC